MYDHYLGMYLDSLHYVRKLGVPYHQERSGYTPAFDTVYLKRLVVKLKAYGIIMFMAMDIEFLIGKIPEWY